MIKVPTGSHKRPPGLAFQIAVLKRRKKAIKITLPVVIAQYTCLFF